VTRQARAAALLALALAIAAAPSCHCRGKASVGDKQGYSCAEVPAKDAHEETDLGGGLKLVRDGVRGEVRGLPADAFAAVTSFETGVAPIGFGTPGPSIVFVVGLGGVAGLDRGSLAAGLSMLAQRAALVVAVAGPADDLDVVRAAIADAGKHVVDGAIVRALRVGGVELVSLPGGDDPPAIPDHGRGCVLRLEDARALALKLGAASVPRVAIAWSAPSRDAARPSPADAIPGVSAWLVAGPADDAWASPLEIGPAPLASASAGVVAPPAPTLAPIVAAPRARTARTTSAPARIAPGATSIRVENGVLVLRDS
jgi:hypothetical protein